MSDRTITINGEVYTKTNADFDKQSSTVLNSIGDEMYDALFKAEAIIAGGAVLSAFTHADISDVDVYFRDSNSLAEAFVAVTADWSAVYIGHTDKSVTLKDRDTGKIVQFIYFDFFEDANEVFAFFDFTVCMAAIELSEKGNILVYDPRFLSDVASRTIHFNSQTPYPYISLVRTRKYREKGYTISKGALLQIGLACSNCPITNWKEAKDQLGGVYGNSIRLLIEEDTPFSQKKLSEILSEVTENSSSNLIQDYASVYKALTGVDYS